MKNFSSQRWFEKRAVKPWRRSYRCTAAFGVVVRIRTNLDSEMTDDVEPILVPVPVRPRRLPEIDEFQRIEGLPSRADALALLLEIGLDAIAGRGRRFWDRPGAAPRRPDRRQSFETF